MAYEIFIYIFRKTIFLFDIHFTKSSSFMSNRHNVDDLTYNPSDNEIIMSATKTPALDQSHGIVPNIGKSITRTIDNPVDWRINAWPVFHRNVLL